MYHNRYKYMCHVCVCSYSIYFCIYCIILSSMHLLSTLSSSIREYFISLPIVRWYSGILIRIADGVYMLLENQVN